MNEKSDANLHIGAMVYKGFKYYTGSFVALVFKGLRPEEGPYEISIHYDDKAFQFYVVSVWVGPYRKQLLC